jgi:FkbM family methyltransferase
LAGARRIARRGLPALGPRADGVVRAALPPCIDAEIANGIRVRLDTRDATQRHTWWQGGRYETPSVAILEAWAGSGAECFFDVGANYGFYSYRLLASSRSIDVYAFEPHPHLVTMLRDAKSRNDLHRLHIVDLALGDTGAELALHVGDSDQGHSTLGDHPVLARGDGIPVQVVTFDEWRRAQGLRLPDGPTWIAKLDVEGYEQRALQGMAGALAAHAFLGVAVELNDYTLRFCGTTPAEVEREIRQHGYVRIEETPDQNRWRTMDTWNAFFVPATHHAAR